MGSTRLLKSQGRLYHEVPHLVSDPPPQGLGVLSNAEKLNGVPLLGFAVRAPIHQLNVMLPLCLLLVREE